jgi:hypothetical protein
VPERNQVEYTRFMKELQLQYFIDEIQKKTQSINYLETTYLPGLQNQDEKEEMKKKIEDMKI